MFFSGGIGKGSPRFGLHLLNDPEFMDSSLDGPLADAHGDKPDRKMVLEEPSIT